METFRNERLRTFMDYLISKGQVYNASDFARKLDINRSQLSDTINGKRTLSPNVAERVKASFPEVNIKWLLEETCTQMLVGNETQTDAAPATAPTGYDVESLLKTIEKQQEQIDRLLGIIEKLQK